MRVALLLVGALLLAGCSNDGAGDHEKLSRGEGGEFLPGTTRDTLPTTTLQDLRAFTARFVGDACNVTVSLDGPQAIVGPDRVRVKAYRMTINAENTGGCQVADPGMKPPLNVYLDGHMRVVRIDGPGDFGPDSARYLHFAFAGSLPPMGFFWDATQHDGRLEYTLGGTRFQAKLEDDGQWRGLEGDRPMVRGSQWVMPHVDYAPDGLVPAAVRFPEYSSWTRDELGHGPMILERVELTWGDALPAIAGYTLPSQRYDERAGLVPWPHEQLFAMNTSLARAMQVVSASFDDAKTHFDRGCIAIVSMGPAGTAGWDEPAGLVLPSHDTIAIQITTYHEGQGVEWLYKRIRAGESLLSPLTAQETETVSRRDLGAGTEEEIPNCGTLHYPPIRGWGNLLVQAYSLAPKADIIPCAATMEWFGHSPTDLAPGVPPRLVIGASSSGHPESDHFYVDGDGTARSPPPSDDIEVWVHPDDGTWHRLQVPPGFAEALDAGTQPMRQPTDFPDAPARHPFRCVPPMETASEPS